VLSYRHITQRLKLDSFTPSTGCVNINKNYTQKGEVRGEAGGSGIWLVLGLDFELQEARRQPIPKNALQKPGFYGFRKFLSSVYSIVSHTPIKHLRGLKIFLVVTSESLYRLVKTGRTYLYLFLSYRTKIEGCFSIRTSCITPQIEELRNN
jgi:hypothetical protein